MNAQLTFTECQIKINVLYIRKNSLGKNRIISKNIDIQTLAQEYVEEYRYNDVNRLHGTYDR